MKVIIVGYGRMGQELSESLIRKNHQVSIIDIDDSVIPEDQRKYFIHGVGFDKEVLEKAEVDKVDALVACTSSDEVNALVARIAKQYYRVPQVVARLYEPKRASIYNMLDIKTISTTEWGIHQAMNLLEYSRLESVLTLGDGDLEIMKIRVPALLEGKELQSISAPGIKPVGLERQNKVIIPNVKMALHKGDILYLACEQSEISKLEAILGGGVSL